METQTENTFNISDIDNMDGYKFEEFCCRLLELNGYTNVINTQASGDYGLDIIATTPEGFICGIQCKNYQGSVGIEAVQQALSGINYYKECNVAVVLTNSTFTKQAIQMAEETNVKLWDRNTLIKLMQILPQNENKIEFETATNITYDTIDIENIDSITDFGFVKFCFCVLKQNGFSDLRFSDLQTNKGTRITSNKIRANKDGMKYTIKCVSGFNYDYGGMLNLKTLTDETVRSMIDLYNQEAVAIHDNRYYDYHYATIILTNGYFTRSAVDLARQNNIVLWDRSKFIELLSVFPDEYISNINNTYKIKGTKSSDYFKFRNGENMTDDELKNAAYTMLEKKGFTHITELPIGQQDIFFIAKQTGRVYGALIKNSTIPVTDNVIVRARELYEEYCCDEVIVITNGGFTDEARKESFIASYKNYSEEELVDMIGDYNVVELWDNKTKPTLTGEVSNTPHLAIISVVLSVICLIITAIGKESILNIISLIISGISVAKYSFTAAFEMQESQKESLKSYEERVSKASKKAKIGTLLSWVSMMIMSIIMVITID